MIPYSQIRQECDLIEYKATSMWYEEIYVHKVKPLVFTCCFSDVIEYNLPTTIYYKYLDE